MTKDLYDQAYEMESRKFPAIFRMTNLNRGILVTLVAIYVIGSFLIAFLLGEGVDELTVLFFIIMGANVAVFLFAYAALKGEKTNTMKVLAMVIVPIWAVAACVVPEIRSVSTFFFAFPLLWLEIMIIFEKIIQKKAQRTAIQLADMERQHQEFERARAFKESL